MDHLTLPQTNTLNILKVIHRYNKKQKMSIATQEKIADFVQNAKQMVTEAVDKVCSKIISLNFLNISFHNIYKHT